MAAAALVSSEEKSVANRDLRTSPFPSHPTTVMDRLHSFGSWSVSGILSQMPSGAIHRIGKLMETAFLYPPIDPEIRKKETRFTQNFWNQHATPDLSLPFVQEIRAHFKIEHREVMIEVAGRKLMVTYAAMQTEGEQAKPYNFVLFPGNLSEVETDHNTMRPFLRSFLEEKLAGKPLPGARFIMLSPRNIKDLQGNYYRPPFDNTGEIHLAILDHLEKELGQIDQIVGFSLGCGVLAQILNALDDNALRNFCKKIWLHASVSSFDEISALYCCGRVLLKPMAKKSGWYVNVNDSILRLLARAHGLGIRFDIGVSGLHGKGDYYFPGKAGLCNSDDMLDLAERGQIQLLQFKLSDREHERAHHAKALDYYNLTHLVHPKDGAFVDDQELNAGRFIRKEEHLARAIMRSSLESRAREI